MNVKRNLYYLRLVFLGLFWGGFMGVRDHQNMGPHWAGATLSRRREGIRTEIYYYLDRSFSPHLPPILIMVFTRVKYLLILVHHDTTPLSTFIWSSKSYRNRAHDVGQDFWLYTELVLFNIQDNIWIYKQWQLKFSYKQGASTQKYHRVSILTPIQALHLRQAGTPENRKPP